MKKSIKELEVEQINNHDLWRQMIKDSILDDESASEENVNPEEMYSEGGF